MFRVEIMFGSGMIEKMFKILFLLQQVTYSLQKTIQSSHIPLLCSPEKSLCFKLTNHSWEWVKTQRVALVQDTRRAKHFKNTLMEFYLAIT